MLSLPKDWCCLVAVPLQIWRAIHLSAIQCTVFPGIETYVLQCAGHATNPRTSQTLVAEDAQALHNLREQPRRDARLPAQGFLPALREVWTSTSHLNLQRSTSGLCNSGPDLAHTISATQQLFFTRALKTSNPRPARWQGLRWERARTDSKILAVSLKTLLSLSHFYVLCRFSITSYLRECSVCERCLHDLRALSCHTSGLNTEVPPLRSKAFSIHQAGSPVQTAFSPFTPTCNIRHGSWKPCPVLQPKLKQRGCFHIWLLV